MRNKAFFVAGLILAIVSVVGIAQAYMGGAPKIVVEGDLNYAEAPALGQVQEQAFGGTSNYTSDTNIFDGDVIIGGGVTITGGITGGKFIQGGGSKTEYSSTTALTLTNDDICTYSLIPVQPIASMNLTLPATSTISSCLTSAGQMMDLLIENTATTTMNLTIVAGTGMDLQEPDGENVVIGQNNFAWLTFVKQADGNMVVRVDETIPAD